MPGIFGMLTGAMGEQDPAITMEDYANQQQAQNRRALGLDANGNLLPADQQPPPGQAAQAAQASSIQQPGQEPNATKTPPSLAANMMELARYEQRQQGFNQALGAGFAAVSQPRDRDWVRGIFNVQPLDAAKMAQTTMQLGSEQQGQDRANAINRLINDPIQGPKIADALHMDWTALRTAAASDPGVAGRIGQALGMPTADLQNLTQLQHMGGLGGANSTLNDITSGVVSKIGGDPAMVSAQAAWRLKHPGQPDSNMPWTPNDSASFKQWQVTNAANEADRQTASGELVDKNEATQTLQNDLLELKDSPGLHEIMTTPGHRELALKALNDGSVVDIPAIAAKWSLSNDEAKAVALLRRIGGATTETAMRGMAGTGTRVTQMEVGPLKDAITMTQNLNQSYEDYVHGAINNAVTKTKRAMAANYGNTGNINNMDPSLAPWLNSAFKKGGQLYKEGSGVDALPEAQPVPDSEIADGKALLADKPYLKDEMLDNWQQRGFDTSKLRSSNPKNW